MGRLQDIDDSRYINGLFIDILNEVEDEPSGAEQFAVADESQRKQPPGTQSKRRAANRGLEEAESGSAQVFRRLDQLLKKNG